MLRSSATNCSMRSSARRRTANAKRCEAGRRRPHTAPRGPIVHPRCARRRSAPCWVVMRRRRAEQAPAGHCDELAGPRDLLAAVGITGSAGPTTAVDRQRLAGAADGAGDHPWASSYPAFGAVRRSSDRCATATCEPRPYRAIGRVKVGLRSSCRDAPEPHFGADAVLLRCRSRAYRRDVPGQGWRHTASRGR